MRSVDSLWGSYSIIQDDRYFKLGQDSVLLSAFAAPPRRAKVLDLGCGNGALGLLVLMRSADNPLCVTGLELQPEAAGLARENAARNGFQKRMQIVTGDLRQHKKLFRTGAFDYVVCNPPYFPFGSGYTAKGDFRSAARQEKTCALQEVAQAIGYAVKYGGRAALVYRPERLCELIDALRSAQLEPKRLRFVHQNAKTPPSAVLLEARRGSVPGVQVLPPLLICGEGGEHTAEYRSIYHEEGSE